MERLLDYIINSLLGNSYNVSPREIGYDGKTSQWRVTFENSVNLYFDEKDVKVLRFMVEMNDDPLTTVRIEKLLTKLV